MAHDYTAHSIIINLAGRNKKVLEVGCASGYLSKILSGAGCDVTAIEIDPQQAEKAKPHCSRVVVGSADDQAVLKEVEDRYDIILFADIIEHLLFPEKTIMRLKTYLKERGFIIVSVPNVANWKIRMNLLIGRFEYADEGIMDSTHVRFYVIKTIRQLLEKSGLRIETFVPGATRMPKFLLKMFPSLFAVHLIFKAVKSSR